jgi:pre-mRNA-splicing factor ATP-dependent RNA helicase DHX38/PRP16
VVYDSITAVEPQWLAELGSKFYSIRAQHFSDRDRKAKDKEFLATSNAEMELMEEFAKDKEEKEERLRAQRSVKHTPRIAGIGTPMSRKTPRRVGL